MPIAIIRLFDAFLQQIGIQERGLNDAFSNIDGDLLKLTAANSDSFLNVEHKHAVQDDLRDIGGAFLHFGIDFHKIDVAGRLVDGFLMRAAGDGSVDIPPTVQTDFVALDHKVDVTATDLKALGLDFLKLGTSPNPETFAAKLHGIGDDFKILGSDMAADGAAFLTLGADFVKLGSGDSANPPALDMAFKALGEDMLKIGHQFDTLAGDFNNLTVAWPGGGGSGAPPDTKATGGGGGAGGPVGTAFMTLVHDLNVLGTDFGPLAHDAVTVVSDLHPAVSLPGADVTRGGHG
jgi:hypothetical protein